MLELRNFKFLRYNSTLWLYVSSLGMESEFRVFVIGFLLVSLYMCVCIYILVIPIKLQQQELVKGSLTMLFFVLNKTSIIFSIYF